MNPGTMIEESQLLGTDIGNRRLRFSYSKYQKIHDCDTLGINNQTSPMEPQDLLELGMGKNQEYFSTMPGTNILSFT
jgi:hypothetical protein